MLQTRMLALLILLVPCLSARINRKAKSDSCSRIGCYANYNRSAACQCNKGCARYGNCCSDFSSLCEGGGSPSCSGRCGETQYNGSAPCQCNSACSAFGDCCPDFSSLCAGSPNPSPTPSPRPPSNPVPTPPLGPAPEPGQNATRYWEGVDMRSKSAIQSRLIDGSSKSSYGGLWTFYKTGWVNLPGVACQGGVYDVYSTKCWTPGSGQCGSYRNEGDCYNREHSWPKSWWSRTKNAAYSDVFHVVPSDGYVNGRRSSHPFGEVNSPTYTSSEGNKVGPCATPGYSGTCFEPTDRVKGLLARGSLYMSVRYMNEFSCCSNDAVDGADLKSWMSDLLLKWSAAHPPQAWEVEFNNRAYKFQGNRNPFIDYPQAAKQMSR